MIYLCIILDLTCVFICVFEFYLNLIIIMKSKEQIWVGKSQLWHSLESISDNNYEVQKSLIRKFPGGKQFMGKEIEVVCLLQGAEIERLSGVLQQLYVKQVWGEFRCKEMQKMPLDRQSYEIQIKQLTDLINQQKSQINNQNGQFDHFKQSSQSILNNLTMKYEKALQTIDSMYNDNTKLQEQINQLLMENNTLSNHKEAMSQSLREYSSLSQDRDNVEIQLRRVQDSLLILSREKDTFRDFNLELSQRLSQMDYTNIQYENKLALISQEVQRLNRVLKERTDEKKYLEAQLNSLIQKIQSVEVQLAEVNNAFTVQRNEGLNIKHRINQLSNRNRQYESLIQKLTTQLQINQQNKTLHISKINQQNNLIKQQNNRIKQQVNTFKQQQTKILKENIALKEQLNKLSQQMNKLSEQMNKILFEREIMIKQHGRELQKCNNIIWELEQVKHNLQIACEDNVNCKQKCQMSLKKAVESNQHMSTELISYENTIRQNQQEIRFINQSNHHLNDQLVLLKNQNQHLTRTHHEIQNNLKRQIQQIISQNNALNQQYRSITVEKQALQTHLLQAQRYIQAFQKQLETNTNQQIALKETKTLLSDLQTKNKSSEAQIKMLNHSFNDARNQIQNLRMEKSKIQQKLISEKNKMQQNLNNMYLNVERMKKEEIERQRQKQNEIGQLKQRINELNTIVKIDDYKRQNEVRETITFSKLQETIITRNQEISYLKDQLTLSKQKIQLLCLEISKMIKLIENLGSDEGTRFQLSNNLLIEIRRDINALRKQNQLHYQNLSNGTKQLADPLNNLLENQQTHVHQKQAQISQITQFQNRCNILEHQNSELSQRYTAVCEENMSLQIVIKNLKKKMSSLEDDYSRQVKNREGRQRQIKEQLEVVRRNLSETKQQLQIGRQKLSKVDQNIKNSNENSWNIKDIKGISQVNMQLQVRIRKLERQLALSQEQKVELFKKIQYIEEQIQQKQVIAEQIRLQLKEQRQKTSNYLKDLIQSKDRTEDQNIYLNQLIKQNQGQKVINEYQIKLHHQQSFINQLQTELQLSTQKTKLLCIEINKLVNLVERLSINEQQRYGEHKNILISIKQDLSNLQKDTNSQILQLQRSQQKSHLIYKFIQAQTSLSNINIQSLVQKIDRLQIDNKQLIKQCSQIDAKKTKVEEERDQLRKMVEQCQQKYKQEVKNGQRKILQIRTQYQVVRNKRQNVEYQQSSRQMEERIRKIEKDLKNSAIKHRNEQENNQSTLKHYQQVISSLKLQNSALKSQNYDISIQLRKAQRLQSTVQVLNSQIDRLSKDNIQYSHQLSHYNLSIGQQSSLQRRLNEHLILFVLLFSEIEALRIRVKDQQMMINILRPRDHSKE